MVQGTFPGWHTEIDERGSDFDVMPFPRKASVQVSIAAVALSAALTFISILWQHTAAIAATTTAQAFGNGNIGSKVGMTAIALGWISSVLLMVSLMTTVALKRRLSLTCELVDAAQGSDRGRD